MQHIFKQQEQILSIRANTLEQAFNELVKLVKHPADWVYSHSNIE